MCLHRFASDRRGYMFTPKVPACITQHIIIEWRPENIDSANTHSFFPCSRFRLRSTHSTMVGVGIMKKYTSYSLFNDMTIFAFRFPTTATCGAKRSVPAMVCMWKDSWTQKLEKCRRDSPSCCRPSRPSNLWVLRL